MIENQSDLIEYALDLLNKSELSKDMSEQESRALAELAELRSYDKGTDIVKENSKSRDLYIIKKGRVSIRLMLPTEEGRDEIVYQMRDNQIFGELSLVDGSPRSATVKAEEDVTVLRYDFNKLSGLLERFPRIGYLLMKNIAAIISARIRSTNLLWRNTLIW